MPDNTPDTEVICHPGPVIAAVLTTHGATAPLLGTRVKPVIAAQDTPPPFAVYTVEDWATDPALSGTTKRPLVLMSVKLYATSYAEAHRTGRAVRKALNGYSGTLAGTTVTSCLYRTQKDGVEIPQDSQMLPWYTLTQFYAFRIEDSTS